VESKDPFDIDPNRLDREWLEQAKLARAAGHREAEARDTHARAKAKLDVVAARTALAVRRNPGAYNLRDKPNQDEIEAAVILSDSHQEAVKELNDAKYALDIASADTTAFVDRRKALERLVDLLALNYRSEKEPQAHTNLGREVSEAAKKRAIRSTDD